MKRDTACVDAIPMAGGLLEELTLVRNGSPVTRNPLIDFSRSIERPPQSAFFIIKFSWGNILGTTTNRGSSLSQRSGDMPVDPFP